MEARRREKQRRLQEAEEQAKALEAEGKKEEATELREAAVREEDEADRVAAQRGDASGLQLLQQAMSADAEAERLKLQARRAEQKRKREEVKRQSAELAAQGEATKALEVMVAAMQEQEEEHENAAATTGAAEAAEVDVARLHGGFAAGMKRQGEAMEKDKEAQRSRMEARKAERQQKKREEAEQRAAELEREAAALRNATASKDEAPKDDVAAPSEEAKPQELDPIAAWQEESRQRAIASAVAESCQKGQEDAARRLVDNTVSEEDRAHLKDSFAKEMARSQQAVASEREAQRRRAQERLEQRRRQREETVKVDKRHSALQKMSSKVRHVMLGVKGMSQLKDRRMAKLLESNREVERRLRTEMEAEMLALEKRLRREAEEEIARLRGKHEGEMLADDAPPVTAGAEVSGRSDKALDVQDVVDRGIRQQELHAEEVHHEKKRQAQRVEERLAERRRKLQERENALRQANANAETRLELEHQRAKLEKKDVSKVKGKRLMKELNKVNDLISNITAASGAAPPEPPGDPEAILAPGSTEEVD